MAKAANKYWIGLLVFFTATSMAGSEIKSPFNGLSLDSSERVEEYSFLIGGHLFGAHGKSVYPSASLLANLDLINASGAKFFVSLGDIVRRADTLHFSNYLESFAHRLKMPLFNAAGNWDVSNRELYEAQFGKTYGSFTYNRVLFVFLDSEQNGRSIAGSQLDFFLSALQNAAGNPDMVGVFIFSHSLVWLANKPDYRRAFEGAQLYYRDDDFKNYAAALEPALFNLSKSKPIYWISGEVGMHWSFPLFYEKDPRHNIAYIAVGIGDTEKDALLKVTIPPSGGAILTPISLTKQKLSPVEQYNLAFWKSYFGRDQGVAGLYFDKARRMAQHIYFWAGIFVSLCVTGLVILLLRRHWAK